MLRRDFLRDKNGWFPRHPESSSGRVQGVRWMKRALRVGADCGTSLLRSHTPIHPPMASTPQPPSPAPDKGWRRRIAIPNLLAPALDERIKEVKRGTFSQHAIET